jgi:hypothetical protein
VAGERTFGDGRFRNGKWEEQDLSDREMRFDGLMAEQNEESLRRTPCKVVYDCCLDSLQGARASIDEPAALWWDVWRCSE